jgi:teichuronic acid exporter
MDLKSKVMAGVGWVAGANFFGQIITWVITIVVMRLLSPADYGLLAMASVFVAFLAMMAAAGLGPAIVQAIAIDDAKLRQLLGLITAINVVLCLLLFSAAPLIAGFFNETRLIDIIRILSLQFVITGFAVIPESLLGRALRFKARALVDLASNLAGGITTLTLAWTGHGVWSLVAGAMVSVSGKTIGLNIASPYIRWPTFSLQGAKPLLAYGGNVTASRILWFFYSQADMFIAGKLLGKEALGFYSVAMHLASLPVQKISGVLNQVAFPAFSQIQRNPEMISRHVLKAIRMLCFFAFPVLWGISSVAPELVRLILGEKWEMAIPPLQILPAIMPFRMVSNFLPSAVDAVGRPDISVKNLFTASIVMPSAFLIGGQWGIQGLCIAWVIAFPLVFLANLTRSLPAINIRVLPFLASMAWPALASGAMYGVVIAVGLLLPADASGWVRFLILVAAGGATYAGLALTTNRSGCNEMLQLVRR